MVFILTYSLITRAYNNWSPERVKTLTEKVDRITQDHNMSILYNKGKANVVVDALSRLFMGSTAHVEEEKRE